MLTKYGRMYFVLEIPIDTLQKATKLARIAKQQVRKIKFSISIEYLAEVLE